MLGLNLRDDANADSNMNVITVISRCLF